MFELCIKNFEITYIAMIKELQEKTFKLNIECNQERSIIMRKREVVMNHNRMFATKFLENQMFDHEGNVLVTNCSSQSLRNSFNHSNALQNNLGMGQGSAYQTHQSNKRQVGGGPHAHISPMLNFRKNDYEDSVKQTCSSQGASFRRQQNLDLKMRQGISPVSLNNPAS
jgi:hypothetical protein